MIDFKLKMEIHKIRKQLGHMSEQAPEVLCNAINASARKIRKQVVQDIREKYETNEVKTDAKFLKMKKAKPGKTVKATLTSSGKMNELTNFVVSPDEPQQGPYAAKVLKDSSIKLLDGNPKPFVTYFNSGRHKAVAVRDPLRKMQKKPNRDYVRKLLGPSTPQMVKNQYVQERANELYASDLPIQIEKQIKKVLKNGSK